MNQKRKNEDKKSKGAIKPEYFLVAIAISGIGYYALRKSAGQQNMSAVPVPGAASLSKTRPVEIISTIQTPADNNRAQLEMTEKRAQLGMIRMLGLKTLEFKNQGETISIPLSFIPKKIWCQAGDLDTLKHVAKNRSDKEFVISLEAIGRAQDKNPFVRVSLNELYQGADFTFTMPRPKDPVPYGLYICSDFKKQNACQHKSAESHAEISAELGKKSDNPLTIDNIFYFQQIIVSNKKAEAYRSNDYSDSFKKSMRESLVNKQGITPADFKTAWEMNSTMKSTPADVKEGKIILSLPYNDPRCTELLTGPKPSKK